MKKSYRLEMITGYKLGENFFFPKGGAVSINPKYIVTIDHNDIVTVDNTIYHKIVVDDGVDNGQKHDYLIDEKDFSELTGVKHD